MKSFKLEKVRGAAPSPSPPSYEGERVVSTLIALRYPNGRVHEMALGEELEPGDRFDLYRRVWVAEHWTTTRRSRFRGNEVDPPRLLCAPDDTAAVGSKVA